MPIVSIVGAGKQAQRMADVLTESGYALDINYFVKETVGLADFKGTSKSLSELKYNKSDFIYIATEPSIQLEALLNINRAECFSILEKPIATNFVQLKLLKQLFKDLNNYAIVNFPHIFDNAFQDFIKYSNNKKYHNFKITEGGNGPIRKNLPPLFDWGSHAVLSAFYIMFPRRSSISINIELLKVYKVGLKEKWHFILKMKSGKNTKYFNIKTGNCFRTKERNSEILCPLACVSERKRLKYNFRERQNDGFNSLVQITNKMNKKNGFSNLVFKESLYLNILVMEVLVNISEMAKKGERHKHLKLTAPL